jgi:uncharacterized protein (TIGR02145 family)
MKNHQNSRLIILFALFILTVILSTCKKEKPPVEPPSPPKEGILFNPDLTYDSISDIDGNTYKTIQIGTQTWMAENLRTTKYNNSTKIPLFNGLSRWFTGYPGFAWYDNDSVTYQYYGAIYNYYTVMTGKLCPTGWHVSTDADWTTLTNFLGGENIAGNKLKEIDTLHWKNPNAGVTNESGFTALPSGFINDSGESYGIGNHCDYWCSNENLKVSAYARMLEHDKSTINRSTTYLMMGLSVRCVKDN